VPCPLLPARPSPACASLTAERALTLLSAIEDAGSGAQSQMAAMALRGRSVVVSWREDRSLRFVGEPTLSMILVLHIPIEITFNDNYTTCEARAITAKQFGAELIRSKSFLGPTD
jgi:hypothetical protein